MCIPPFGLRLPRVASLAEFLVMSGLFHLSVRFLNLLLVDPKHKPDVLTRHFTRQGEKSGPSGFREGGLA